MPMRWTAENNELLLLKILETHEIKIDYAKIAAAWPKGNGETPTPRAITERLTKIRANVNGAGKAKTTTAATPSKPKSAGSNDPFTTPRRFNAANTNSNGTSIKSKSTTQKRKREKKVKDESDDEPMNTDDSDALVSGVTAKELTGLKYGMDDPFVDNEGLEDGSARKRSRSLRMSVPAKYEESGEDNGESDVSTFEATV